MAEKRKRKTMRHAVDRALDALYDCAVLAEEAGDPRASDWAELYQAVGRAAFAPRYKLVGPETAETEGG